MFLNVSKQVESTTADSNKIITKKSSKKNNIAFENLEKSQTKIKETLESLNKAINKDFIDSAKNANKNNRSKNKPEQDLKREMAAMKKEIRDAIRQAKEADAILKKYKNSQYKTTKTTDQNTTASKKLRPTGLKKLRPISENMALFTSFTDQKWEYGVTEKSRYDVTNLLCAYIKKNDLRNSKNRSIIVPDAKLKKLLQLEDDIELRYPTMQKYLKYCFEEIEDQPEEVDQELPKGKKQPLKSEKEKENIQPKNKKDAKVKK